MRKLAPLGVIVVVSLATACWAAGPFSAGIANLWLRGDKTRVLQIAEQRLARNSEDMVGLLLKHEYQETFLLVPEIYTTLDQVDAAARRISSPHFAKLRSLVLASTESNRRVLARLSPEQLDAERPKGAVPNKPLASIELIEALEADGYVTAADLPPDLLQTPSP